MQTGRDYNLLYLHDAQKFHPGQDRIRFSQYVSKGGYKVELASDSCVCKACFSDCARNAQTVGCTLHWLRVKQEYYRTRTRHCIFCCDTADVQAMSAVPQHDSPICYCRDSQDWGPSTWQGGDIDSPRKHRL